MNEREALKLALEALEMYILETDSRFQREAITAIKEALAQPEQRSVSEHLEPVAYGMWDSMIGCGGRMMYVRLDKGQDGCTVPLYTTTPPVPTAQPKQEKNFCQRCGKQLGKNDWDIHTCTPPQPKELEQKPVAVMELYTDGWDLVEGIDTDWLETLPFGTRLFSHPPVTTAQPEQEPVAWEEIETIANKRYKVVQSHDSMFYRYAVVAGDGTRQVYLGREVECENMARKFAGAFLDGAFAMKNYTTPPQRQPLTEKQIVAKALHLSGLGTHPDVLKFARAIEAAHGIKGDA